MTSPALLLIGCGRMGSALVRGWSAKGSLDQGLAIITPRKESCIEFLNHPFVTWHPSAEKIDTPPQVIIFAVKPQKLAEVLPTYRSFFSPGVCALTVVAAKSMAFYQDHLGQDVALVRAMPNTPCSIGRGISLALASEAVTTPQKEKVHELLSAVGKVAWFNDEGLLDRAAVLTACGPAYLYRFIEALTAAAEELGLEASIAGDLAQEMIVGSAAYLDVSNASPTALREQVTSPNGTTAAALRVMDDQEAFNALISRALQAAVARTYEMQGEKG